MPERINLANLFPLLRRVLQVPYLTLDIVGCLIIGLGAYIGIHSPLAHMTFSIGATLITVGISLPVGIFFQEAYNSMSFALLRNAEISGIRSVFPSRRTRDLDFRNDIDQLAATTHNIDLLGIAFRSLFDPDQTANCQVSDCIRSPNVRLRVILLNPDSDAAKRRSKIEIGGRTIDDIQTTIKNLLPAIFEQRLIALGDQERKTLCNKWNEAKSEEDRKAVTENAIRKLKCEVRFYEVDPMAFLMQFDDAMLLEQYHFGRPNDLVPFGGCIGQYLPVLEFRSDSVSYKFMAAHFEYMWNNMSQPITESLVNALLERHRHIGTPCLNDIQ